MSLLDVDWLLQMAKTQKNKATSGHLGLLKVSHVPPLLRTACHRF